MCDHGYVIDQAGKANFHSGDFEGSCLGSLLSVSVLFVFEDNFIGRYWWWWGGGGGGGGGGGMNVLHKLLIASALPILPCSSGSRESSEPEVNPGH